MGRPSDYKPEYCTQLISHMSQGLSFETFAAVIGTSRATIYNWADNIPEFLDAKKTAMDLCQLFWEKKGLDGLYSTKECHFNSSVWIFNMKARFRWRDEEMKELPLPPEKQALTFEDKKLLLIQAKEQIKNLEEEIAKANERILSSS